MGDIDIAVVTVGVSVGVCRGVLVALVERWCAAYGRFGAIGLDSVCCGPVTV